jgi:hypothetical protein
MIKTMVHRCTICGQEHPELPHIGSAAPFHWADTLAEDSNSLLTEDLCIIEGRVGGKTMDKTTTMQTMFGAAQMGDLA